MLMFQGFARSSDGVLSVIGVAATDVLPAGTQMFNGLARSPSGALYVVFG